MLAINIIGTSVNIAHVMQVISNGTLFDMFQFVLQKKGYTFHFILAKRQC